MNRLIRAVLWGGICWAILPVGAADVFDVRGAGWWEDRLIERALRDLRNETDEGTVDANAVEDAVFFAMSSVADKGFLEPSVSALITPVEGAPWSHEFDMDFANLLPRPLQAQQVRLELDRGVRYRFGEVSVTGSEPVMPAKDAQDLIVPPSGLFPSAEAQAFTPDRLQTGLGRIALVLAEDGYSEARARVVAESRDPATGRVDVEIAVTVGPRWWVRSVDVVGMEALGSSSPEFAVGADRPWTVTWGQDQAERIRQMLYPQGYADVRVAVQREPGEVAGETRPVDVRLKVESGEVVRLGEIEYRNAGNINERTLVRRIELGPGELMDVLALEQSRRRLARLPAFRRVILDYEPETGDVRSPVFRFERRLPWESHLLAGWGSYEKLRGGFEVRGNNLWRRSHQLRLEGMVSAKSIQGNLIYTVPELLGETIDGSVRLFGLDRDEFAFQRQEYGSTLALSRRALPWLEADGAVSYTFQNLISSESALATRLLDLTESRSASLMFTLNRDRRDNPLSPTEGYRWYTQFEVADQALGGEVGYQRLELGASWHRAMGDTIWIHLGFTHGTVWTLGQANDLDLPVNKRFFPGGEHSYRGVQNGEGTPIDANGEFVGAKTSTLINIEIEQALTTRISGVLFVDVLGAAAELSQSPWDDVLVAAGVGLRYDTIIGPLRLEYGHNLNPRSVDPRGTLHFSIGFPF
jgi:outer membrane protein insertion porin family